MAVPVMLGVPVVVGILMKFFGRLFEFFATRFSVAWASNLAWLTLYVGMVVALTATFDGFMQTISVAMPQGIRDGIGFINPGNVQVCVGAYYSARVALWFYDHKQRILNYQANSLTNQLGGSSLKK